MEQAETAQVLPRIPWGFHAAKVDSAGRLKLPAKYVEFISGLADKSLYITNMQGTARIFTNGSWARNLQILAADRELRRRLGEYYDSMGGDVDMDPQGRITIPKNTREKLPLEDVQVMLRFDEDQIFIYTMDVYQARISSADTLHQSDLAKAIQMGFDC